MIWNNISKEARRLSNKLFNINKVYLQHSNHNTTVFEQLLLSYVIYTSFTVLTLLMALLVVTF